jgi:DNA-binding NtrC family response regulator
MPTSRRPPADEDPPGKHVVLILSTDSVAAALIGALVETLGYLVTFFTAPDSPDDVMRRVRPAVALVDCADPTLMNAELLGRATMRGISVVIFGVPDTIRRVQDLVHTYGLATLIMPASMDMLDDALRAAIEKDC